MIFIYKIYLFFVWYMFEWFTLTAGTCNFPQLTNRKSFIPNKDNYVIGEIIEVACRYGFRFTPPQEIFATCREGGVWDINNGYRRFSDIVCHPVICGPPASPRNGYISGNTFLYGGRVVIHCNTGYELKTEIRRSFIFCHGTGRWFGISNIKDACVGIWNSWNSWNACSVTCGRGLQLRRRSCSACVQSDCVGKSVERRNCSQEECPIEIIFGRKVYGLFQINATYDNAVARCNQFGGNLPVISNFKINQVLRDLIGRRTQDSRFLQYYIGMKRNNRRRFVWNDGTSISYSNWGNGQPDNYRLIENCAAIRFSGSWIDLPCNIELHFICEKVTCSVPILENGVRFEKTSIKGDDHQFFENELVVLECIDSTQILNISNGMIRCSNEGIWFPNPAAIRCL